MGKTAPGGRMLRDVGAPHDLRQVKIRGSEYDTLGAAGTGKAQEVPH